MSIRTTFVLIVFLALVAGYFIVAEEEGTSEELVARPPWFYTVSTTDINEITIRTGAAEETFVNTVDGWVIEGPQRLPVDLSRWSGVTLLLSGPRTQRVLHESVDDLSLYGLDDPQVTIDVTLVGDRKVRAFLGDTTPDAGSHYVMQEGDPRLYTIDASWGRVLGSLAVVPPRPTWYYQVPSQRVDYLAVTHGGSEIAFDKGFDGVWKFAEQGGSPLDQDRWAQVLPKLGGPSELIILQNLIAIDEFARFGLDAPQTVIEVEYNPPESIQEFVRRVLVMEIGGPLPDGSGYYTKIQGEPFLLSVDAPWYEAIRDLVLDPPVAAEASGG